MWAYFAQFGALDDVALIRDKQTGLPRGFGFVTFKDAMAYPEYLIEFRMLEPGEAVPAGAVLCLTSTLPVSALARSPGVRSSSSSAASACHTGHG